MWICFNDAFVSAVEDKNDRNMLKVRARNVEHLEALFPGKEIIVTYDSDYIARVVVSKKEFAKLVAKSVEGINYGNFKDSVLDEDLHNVYAKFWGIHWNYQRKLSFVPAMKKKLANYVRKLRETRGLRFGGNPPRRPRYDYFSMVTGRDDLYDDVY